MAIYIQGVGASNGKLTVAGVDLTSRLRSITINQEFDTQEVTAFNATSKAYAIGLGDDSIEVELYQDFAASSTDATLYALVGSSTGSTVIFQTSGSTVTTTNPKYTLVSILPTYQPVDGAVGDVSITKVKFMPAAGQAITRGTS